MVDCDLFQKEQTVSNVSIKSAARQLEFSGGRKPCLTPEIENALISVLRQN
jgi:hypothetical protein